jgi:predicted RND superfamily exporter protein
MVIGGFVLLTLVSTGIATQTDVNSDPLTYFPEDSDLNKATRFIEEHLGGSIAVELVIDSKQEEGIKDPAFLRKVDELQQWIGERPYTRSTVSIVDILKATNKSLNGDDPAAYRLPETREAVAQEYLMYTMGLPQGMDLNDRVSLKNDALRLTANLDIHDSNSVIAAIAEMDAKAAALGLDMHATGKIPIWQRMNPYVVKAFVVSLLIAISLMSLLLIAVFRSVGLGLLAMIPNTMPLLVAGALLVLIGKTLDMGTVIVFSVCLGIAVDDTVHFLTAYNRLRREGHDAQEAVARIFTYTLPACLFTTVILVIGFGVFVFAAFVPNVFFGLMCAVVLSVALAADVFLLPALLMSKRAVKADPGGAG